MRPANSKSGAKKPGIRGCLILGGRHKKKGRENVPRERKGIRAPKRKKPQDLLGGSDRAATETPQFRLRSEGKSWAEPGVIASEGEKKEERSSQEGESEVKGRREAHRVTLRGNAQTEVLEEILNVEKEKERQLEKNVPCN